MAVKSGSIDRLREQYGICIRYSFIAALFIHLCIFYFSPPFEFRPYSITYEEPWEVVPLPADITVDPPPPPVTHPPVNIEPVDDGSVTSNPIIPKNVSYRNEIFTPIIGAEAAELDPYYYFDEPPVLMKYVNPVYPELAKQAGIEGSILLSVLVGIDGTVLDVSVLRSDATTAMEKAAIEAARLFLFRAATQNTVAVKARISIPIVFRLR